MAKNSNAQLVEFFETADPETICSLIEIMSTLWQFAIDEIKEKITSLTDVPPCRSRKRNELAAKLAIQLRYYGSNDFAYLARHVFKDEGGVAYMEIVRDVAKLLNKKLKTKTNIPRVASLADYEQTICEQILQIQFQDKTKEEIAQILNESGLKKDAAAQAGEELAKVGAAGVSIVALVKILGKKAVTEIIKRVVFWLIVRFVGKEAAQKIIEVLFKKVTQQALRSLIGVVGWALIAWDISFGLAGPAKRVTVPCVALISAARFMERMKDAEEE